LEPSARVVITGSAIRRPVRSAIKAANRHAESQRAA